jgi:hypothetical protein
MSNIYPPPPREIDLTADKSKRRQRWSQSRAGIGYKAGKSDTPLGIVVAEFRFVANSARQFRRSARALPVTVGEGIYEGVRRDRNSISVAGQFRRDGGCFNCVKYSLGLFNGEPRYFTGSEHIENRR